jgi:hypothetical protein
VAQDAAGLLWIGYRQQGYEVRDPKTGRQVYPGRSDKTAQGPYVRDFLLPPGIPPLIAGYGDGLILPGVWAEHAVLPAKGVARWTTSGLPAPARAPALVDLTTMLKQVQALHNSLPVGAGDYLGEDWRSFGDWVGRYGRQRTVLCAASSPFDQDYFRDIAYKDFIGQIGPHFPLMPFAGGCTGYGRTTSACSTAPL